MLKRNLARPQDWIVINCTLAILSGFAQADARLRAWLIDKLHAYEENGRKFAASRARTLLREP